MICRTCGVNHSNTYGLCDSCHRNFQTQQCVWEIRGCTKFLNDHWDEITNEQLLDLVVIRKAFGEIIDKISSVRKNKA